MEYIQHSGYSVKTTPKGYRVKLWSNRQGEITGLNVLIKYSENFPEGMNLEERWDEQRLVADMLFERAIHLYMQTQKNPRAARDLKVLRHGMCVA